MKVVTIGLIFVVLLASAAGQGNIISDGIYNFLHSFRGNMPCGFPNLGVGPLAPFQNPFLPVNINMNEFAFQGNFHNLRVDDMNTFQIRNVDFNMILMRMDFHFFYNSITATGSFSNGFGRSPNNCALSGNGAFAIRGNQVNYHLTAWMVLRNNALVMGDMITRVTIGSFNSNIQNFVGTLDQSNACNRALETWMPWLFQSNEAVVSQYLDSLLRPIADNFISGMTFQDLLNFLVNPPAQPVCRP